MAADVGDDRLGDVFVCARARMRCCQQAGTAGRERNAERNALITIGMLIARGSNRDQTGRRRRLDRKQRIPCASHTCQRARCTHARTHAQTSIDTHAQVMEPALLEAKKGKQA